MAHRTIQDLVEETRLNARIQLENRRDNVRQTMEEFRTKGVLTAAQGGVARFAANNRTGLTLLSGRVSLGIIRPPHIAL